VTRRRGAGIALLGTLALVLLGSPAPAQAADCPKPKAFAKTDVPRVKYPGLKRLRYCTGPYQIKPGQNNIYFRFDRERPKVPGFITRFKPNLVYPDGRVPRVDVLHLHHAVWLVNFYPTFATGEEKTILQAPRGFGWAYKPSDSWILNDMIHNLTPTPATVYITYDLDFLPASAPAAAKLKTVRTQWMDVAGLRPYPVFNALRGYGSKGRFTFPDQAPPAEQPKIGGSRRWTAGKPVTLVATAGHVHPGGLYTDLKVTRDGKTKRLFRSRAKYWEPAGPVSWNFAMTGTPPNWRIKLKRGDTISVSATYGVDRASWYEAMGIMGVAVYEGVNAGGVDPFEERYPTKGRVTHGELPENSNSGGDGTALRDPRTLKAGKAPTKPIGIKDFLYARGDLNKRMSIPTIERGQSITFRNDDAKVDIQHSVTACKAPCTGRTGVAFPLANGPVVFDSATLGFGPAGFTAAANRDTWSTPSDLKPATYSYFCRIHPFMRGAFRVKE
jgi:plastocyanin